MSAATFVHCNSAAALESVAHTHPGWPLVVTGHSMGGKYFRLSRRVLVVYTGGKPCCIEQSAAPHVLVVSMGGRSAVA